MSSDNRFGILRNILRAFGLGPDAVDDIVNWIADLLAGKSEPEKAQAIEFPYRLRDEFLSAAELSFYGVLKEAVNGRATISAKVGLGDLFWVKTDDQSRKRIYTNKIDRKHVDFVLCDPVTMRPLAGIELDDKSHQRADRQARDEFVDQVFTAAGLPIIHIPAKRGYVVNEIAAQLESVFGSSPAASASSTPPSSTRAEGLVSVKPAASISVTPAAIQAPICPKCGNVMLLRTAKSGANAGSQFWGCSGYPNCRSMMPYNA